MWFGPRPLDAAPVDLVHRSQAGMDNLQILFTRLIVFAVVVAVGIMVWFIILRMNA